MPLKKKIREAALLNAEEFDGKASPKAITGKILGSEPEARKDVPGTLKLIDQIIADVNSLSDDERKSEMKKSGLEVQKRGGKPEIYELPELPNAKEGKVVLRLAPYPSGPLHVGNAKPFLINDEYAKRYKGKLILVIDDTIGSAEKQIAPDAYNLIPEGLKWLGVNFDKKIIYKSDRMELYYKYAEEMFAKDKAYVCECLAEELRENRAAKKECSHRKQTVEENKQKWDDMLAGKYEEGKAAVRIKTDMAHKNPAFRDRVLLRLSNRKHPKVGNKYKVWPMLEFSWAIDDYLLGITHVIRGKDLMIESDMQNYIWEIFRWKGPELLHAGLLKIEGVKLSKSKAQAEVQSGEYEGWDDPRTWSLQSLKKRGIQPEALREFAIQTGFTLNEVTVPIDKLYAFNKKIVDPIANRYFAVIDPTEINISDTTKSNKTIEVPSVIEAQGKRKLQVTNSISVSKEDYEKNKGKDIRLRHLVDGTLNKKFKEKEVKGQPQVLQWVPSDENVEIKLIYEDGRKVEAKAEKNITEAENKVVQLERLGFFHIIKEDKVLKAYFAHK